MENHHARKIGKYCRARYADIGHATTQRPAGKFNFGHNFANFIVRRARGERIYKNSSSGGNRGGKTSRRKIRQTEKKNSTQIQRNLFAVEVRKNFGTASGENFKRTSFNFLEVDKKINFFIQKKSTPIA